MQPAHETIRTAASPIGAAPNGVQQLCGAVASALASTRVAVLAVSGGLDSMALLHGAVRSGAPSSLLVATFDHATGPAARRAAGMVARTAAGHGLECVSGRSGERGYSEAAWRHARWRFLREVAASRGGSIVTAHTRDDQVETVFMRVLRDAGPRGLAGLYAPTDVLRPLLHLRRATLAAALSALGGRFATDPSNSDLRYLRNRVRHQLMPAILRARPGFDAELLDLAGRAATWRAQVDQLAASIPATIEPHGAMRIARNALIGYDPESLRVLWPALAARAGVVMDRRGTHRLAAFTIEGATGGTIQLSGGIEVIMRRNEMILRRWRGA